MKLLKWMLALVIALVTAVFVAGQFVSTTLEVEHSTTINAPRAQIFDELIRMRSFNSFSPWYDLDPDAQYSYEGPESGIGSKMSWKSNDPNVGNGWMQIAGLSGRDKIDMTLGFDGFDGEAKSWYLLDEMNAGTRVTWGYASDISSPFFLRFMGPFIQEQITKNYEDGLANLKTNMESR
ncbi:MAG: SRPBCC family protein [Pseudomonadota bacterium]